MITIITVLITFAAMEGVAWLTHKYVMHGMFWSLHRDHHYKDHYGFLERNDFFFLIFAIPGIACLALGTLAGISLCTSVGCGISIYGACILLFTICSSINV
jgi:beta-carotene 3-hydroxylase